MAGAKKGTLCIFGFWKKADSVGKATEHKQVGSCDF